MKKPARIAFRNIPELVWMLRYPVRAVQDLLREVGDFFERGWWGYARTDVWSLEGYLAAWLPSALRQMRDGWSYPPDLTPDEWQEKLSLMIGAFEDAFRLIDMDYSSHEEAKELIDHSKPGMQEFIDRFYDLWD